MSIQYYFDNVNNQLFLLDTNGIYYSLEVDTNGNVFTSISGTSPSNGFLPISGGSITGNLVAISGAGIYAALISGTTMSGNAIYQNGLQVTNNITGLGNISVVSNTNGTITLSGASSGGTIQSGIGYGNVTVLGITGTNLLISGTQYVLPNTLNGLTSVNSSVISGTTISGNNIFVNGISLDAIYANVSGDTFTGAIFAPLISGTTISGSQIYVNGQLITPYVYISGANYGSTEVPINFGTTPTNEGTFIITDQRVIANSFVNAFPSATVASGRVGYDDYQWDNITFTTIAASGSFTVYAKVEANNSVVGNRTLRYTIF